MARHSILIRSIAPAVAGSSDFQKRVLVFGTASLATTRQEFASSQAGEVSERLGYGNLSEAVRTLLEYGAADIKVVAIPVASSTMDEASSVQHTGTGQATFALSGTPYDAYEIQLEILQGGSQAEATYRLSLDDGRTFFPPRSFAGGLAIPLEAHPEDEEDFALTFTGSDTAGDSFVAGDTYTLTTQEAKASDVDLRRAVEEVSEIYPDGNYLIAQAVAPSEWVGYQTLLQQLLRKQNLVRLTLPAPYQAEGQSLTEWVDSLKNTAQTLNETRLSIVAAFAPIPHTSGLQIKPLVNGAALLEATLSKAPVHHSIAWVGGYPLPVSGIYPQRIIAGEAQNLGEAHLKSLDEAGLITTQHHRRINGIRFADDNTVSTGGGSQAAYKIHQGRIEDKATALMLTLITNSLGKSIDPDLLSELAARVESLIANAMIKIAEPEIKSVAVEFKGGVEDLEIVLNLGGIPTVGDILVTRKLLRSSPDQGAGEDGENAG